MWWLLAYADYWIQSLSPLYILSTPTPDNEALGPKHTPAELHCYMLAPTATQGNSATLFRNQQLWKTVGSFLVLSIFGLAHLKGFSLRSFSRSACFRSAAGCVLNGCVELAELGGGRMRPEASLTS